MANDIIIEGFDEVIETIKKVGELPQKCVNKAAKKGIQIAKKSAKNGRWVDQTGYLRKAIKEKAEKTKTKGKKVYDLWPDPSYNDVFVKTTKKGKRAYYPASIEYGFKTKSDGYVPGFKFLHNSLTDNKSQIENTIVSTLADEIDKLK